MSKTIESEKSVSQPDFVTELIEKGTVLITAPTKDELTSMISNIPSECKYMVGAIGRSSDGSSYTLQVDTIKN